MYNVLFVLLLIGLISCNSKQQKTVSESVPQTSQKKTSRPDTVKRAFQIEGMTESIQMYLVQTPESFPIQFSMYVPVDMQTEIIKKENSIHITAAFGGKVSNQTYLSIVAFPSQLTAQQAKEKTGRIAQSAGGVLRDSKAHSWAKTEYRLQNEKSGFLALAQADNNRWFYVKASYPPEYGDGMGPRIHLVIENWRWSKSGKPLSKE